MCDICAASMTMVSGWWGSPRQNGCRHADAAGDDVELRSGVKLMDTGCERVMDDNDRWWRMMMTMMMENEDEDDDNGDSDGDRILGSQKPG